MNSIDVEVLRSAIDWLDRGHRVMLGTVVRTWGSAPAAAGLADGHPRRRPGGRFAVGRLHRGRPDRPRRAGRTGAALPQVTSYGATAEEAQRFGLPCGGTVQIVLEPLSARSQLRELLAAIEGHRVVRAGSTWRTGVVQLARRRRRRRAALRRHACWTPCTARGCAC